MPSIFATSGATFSISTTSTAPGTYDASGYGALTYAACEPLENLGSFGDASNEVTFDDIANGRTLKIKGQRNAGNMELVFAYDDTDAGQGYLKTAEEDDSTADWHFKVTLPNKQNDAGADAIIYFSGKVMTQVIAAETADNVTRRNVTIGINTGLVVVNSTAG